MNKALIGVAVLAFTFAACEKKKSSILPPPEVDTVYIDTNTSKPIDTSLTITGLKDLRMLGWATANLNISVNRNNGEEQRVTMSVRGLPENTEARWDSENGYTTFTTWLKVNTMLTAPGVYPLTINAMTEKGKSKDYLVNLVVDTPANASEANYMFLSKVANMFETRDTTLDSIVYQNTLIYHNTAERKLYFRYMVLKYSNSLTDFFLSSAASTYHTEVMFDSKTGKLTIPEQKIPGRSLSGNNNKDFKVWGQGNIDIKKGMVTLSYYSEYDNGGTPVTNYYILEGKLNP